MSHPVAATHRSLRLVAGHHCCEYCLHHSTGRRCGRDRVQRCVRRPASAAAASSGRCDLPTAARSLAASAAAVKQVTTDGSLVKPLKIHARSSTSHPHSAARAMYGRWTGAGRHDPRVCREWARSGRAAAFSLLPRGQTVQLSTTARFRKEINIFARAVIVLSFLYAARVSIWLLVNGKPKSSC